jgi:uncharacterized protein YdeI (YjbR/CyaY-like superfamily)
MPAVSQNGSVPDSPMFFASPEQWRDWLAEHHDTEPACLVGFIKVTTGEATMTWSQSVDQALCFGWIDGVRRRIDDRSYSIRFTPRKPSGNWSKVNLEKMAALEAAGLMTDAGRRAFGNRTEAKTAIYSYEREAGALTEEQEKAFRRNKKAWTFWEAQAAWYRRNATHFVIGAKRQETRDRRFAQLVADSEAGLRLKHLRATPPKSATMDP